MKMPQPKDAMRGFLAAILLTCFMTALFWVIQHEVPQANSQLVTYMLGQLSVFTGMAVGFYYVTSKSSADKNDVMEHLQLPPPSRGQYGQPLDVNVTNGEDDPVPTEETHTARAPLGLTEDMETRS